MSPDDQTLGWLARKVAEDAAYIARRDAHRDAWIPTLPGFRSDPQIAVEVETDYVAWVEAA